MRATTPLVLLLALATATESAAVAPQQHRRTQANLLTWLEFLRDLLDRLSYAHSDDEESTDKDIEFGEDEEVIVSDPPSDTPSGVPSMQPSDIPSLQPSDAPSLAPSDVPSDVPSMAPSDMPSLAPSDAPSSIPSDAPSDVPSAAPSLAPTTLPPSDYPSIIPREWNGDEVATVASGFEQCDAATPLVLDDLVAINVLYVYEMHVEEGTDINTVTPFVDNILREAVLDTSCTDAAVHAVSTDPYDQPAAVCDGEACSVMMGRVVVLVDPETDGESVYCTTLMTTREMIEAGGLANVPGVVSTSNLEVDTSVMVPYECEGMLIAPPIEMERDMPEPEEKEHFDLIKAILSLLGLSSAFAVVVGLFAMRRRRRRQQQTEETHLSQFAASDEDTYYNVTL